MKNMDYDNEALWKGADFFSNCGQELREDSLFLLSWNEAPDECGIHCSAASWFNDPRALAGYLKYALLKETAYLMYPRRINRRKATLEEYIAVPTADGWYTDAQEELRRVRDAVDDALHGPESELMTKLEYCVQLFSECFLEFPISSGAKLVCGVSELKKLAAALAEGDDDSDAGLYENALEYLNEKLHGQLTT